MADDPLKIDWDKVQIEQRGGWAGDTLDWGGAFLKSAVESIPELVGITPSAETLRFRSSSPVGGFLSEVAGTAVPYMGWMKAARGIKALEAIATGVKAEQVGTAAGDALYAGRALEAPFTTAAKAEAVRLLPFELGRNMANQVVGDKSWGEMAVDSGLNIALGSGLMGGLSKFGATGKVARPLREVVDVDETLPPQLLLRKIDEIAPTAPPETVADILDRRAKLDEFARREEPPKGTRYVDPALAGKENLLERAFKPGTIRDGYVDVKLPTTGSTAHTYATPEQWQNVYRAAGIDPADVSTHMQFPRILEVNGGKEIQARQVLGEDLGTLDVTTRHAAKLEENFLRNLDSIGDGWLMKRESPDGMYVVAKKVAGDVGEVVPQTRFKGEIGGRTKTWASQDLVPEGATNVREVNIKSKIESKPGPEDKWILFKTDSPGRFAKESQQFLNTQVAMEKWIVGETAIEKLKKQTGLAADIAKLPDTFPQQKYTEVAQAAGGAKNVPGFMEKVWPKSMKGNAALESGKDMLRSFIAPFDHQFGKNPHALWTANMGRLIKETAETYYQKLLQGELKLEGGHAILSKYVPAPGTVSLETLWQTVVKEGHLDDIMRLYRNGAGADAAKDLGVSTRAAKLARDIENAWRAEHTEFARAAEAAGAKVPEFKEGTFGLPRKWEGDYFHLVRDEGGSIVGAAAGGSARAAAKNAQALAEQLTRESGAPRRTAEAFHRNAELTALPQDVVPFLRNPGGMLGDRALRGFKWDTATPTLEDILRETHNYAQGRARVLGTNMRDALLQRHVDAVVSRDPAMAKDLIKRFDQMAGREGEFSKIQNKLADKILSPLGFGSNTATRLVQTTNRGMNSLQLGFFKASYPLQNVIGVIQTVGPELAMVMNAPESHMIHRYGSTWVASGRDGAVGSVTAVTPAKVMGQTITSMWNPARTEREALEWAVNNRVIDSRAVEDYIGQGRRSLSNWKGALSSSRAFADFTLALSEWLPVHSERFARTFSFMAAYKTFKDVHKIADEDVLRGLAKRFTEHTNYLYGASDRPVAFTGPIGSSLGLFKNWQMNYMYKMAEYANLGMNQGVWSPLLWQTMGTAAVGGLAASPLYWAAEGASRFFKQKHAVQYAYDEWKDYADGIMFGLPAALTGVSLSSLMTSPGADPVKDATQLFSLASWSG
jgi:hypothetical protein